VSDEPSRLICPGYPPSANKKNSELRDGDRAFLASVRRAYEREGHGRRDGLLYGVVYWFTRRYVSNHPDADNMSKKIWDKEVELGGLAFGDDRQVRLRIAAVFHFGQPRDADVLAEVDVLNLPNAPGVLLDAVGELIAASALGTGFTYIEVGRWAPDMIRFGAGSRTPPGRSA
jgi:Holliday junction resolvase RusA-like endonuclease